MSTDTLASSAAQALGYRIRRKEASIGIIGLGYVGLPLAAEFAQAGYPVLGIDVDRLRIDQINQGHSYVGDVPGPVLARLVTEGRLKGTTEFEALAATDVVVICVQTPFTVTKEPDLSFVVSALEAIRRYLHREQLVILQSTTYPGTTEEVALPLLESSGLHVGTDFFLAFSPERVDPGNPRYTTRNIPKVVGGITQTCTVLAGLLFAQIVEHVHPVSSTRVAEMTKLLENVFRSVNIALVNELTILCERMNVNTWEIIDAAATKPFGFMPFYPGPGVGGHCIPVDPYYLSWKAKAYDFSTKFIVLAAEINENMPYYVVDRVTEAINNHLRRSVIGTRVFGLGISYKGGVGDVRESPALKVLSLLKRRGAIVAYHDPYVAHALINGTECGSAPLTVEEIRRADCVVVLTAHDCIDYAWVAEHASLIFDTRNVMRAVADPQGKILRL